MRYTITFTEIDFRSLTDHLRSSGSTEQGAYLLCSLSVTAAESRLLVRNVVPILPEEIISTSGHHMEILPKSFMRAMKRADADCLSFAFVHSHPEGPAGPSPQDDITESDLFRTAYIRIRGVAVHASLVVSGTDQPRARVWHRDGTTSPVEVIRIIGDRFRFFHHELERRTNVEVFDRQVKAFGIENQDVLKTLHIGIVGNGGTGSAVAEQSIRLGVGKISLFEGQTLDASNVTRVYGSRLNDIDVPKVEIIQRLSKEIGLGTEVVLVPEHITSLKSAEALRDCDMVFGCTDDELGRAILSRLAVDYYIPVIDMGVRLDSKEGLIVSVQGRVTTLIPGSACLFCRGRITAEGVRAQVIESCNSLQAEELRRQRYAPELEGNAPAVIAFTTAVASTAIAELLHRLTGFMGVERTSTEVIHFFDQSMIRTNRIEPNPDCYCGDRQRWGIGDQRPFLGMIWQG